VRELASAARLVGFGLLALAALVGTLLSAAVLFAFSPLGRSTVASAVVRIVDDALAGTLELEGIAVLPDGRVEIRGLRVFDPDGHLVLAVDRARVRADVTRLGSRVIGLGVELDGPSVLLEEEQGGVSLARAFASARPGTDEPEVDGGPGFTLRLSSLVLRNGEVWWVAADGATRLEARGLDLDARGAYGPRQADVTARLTGVLDLPMPAPVALDLVLDRSGDRLRLPVLRLTVGDTVVAMTGEGDLARRTARVAVSRLGVSRDQARVLLPATGPGSDLTARLYAESDGTVATAAALVMPIVAGETNGRADAAAALRLDLSRAVGFDVALDRLDPSRLHEAAPAGEVTLTARGAAAGGSLADLGGHAVVALERSRLRGGEVGPGRLDASAERGVVQVRRLTLRAPGVALEGAGRWSDGGPIGGRLGADVADAAVATRNVSRLLGEDLPAIAGRARLEATLSGTTREPSIAAKLDAPTLGTGGLEARGLALTAELTGPLREPTGVVDGRAAALRSGGDELIRAVSFHAGLERGAGALTATAAVPGLGKDPVMVEARGTLGGELDRLDLTGLDVSYPGTRYTLARGATLRFAGPSVDRHELAAGRQRIVVEGGFGARGRLDARLVAERVDLTALPAGLLPAGLTGLVSLDARATGTTRRPKVEGRVAVEDGAYRTLRALAAEGELTWDGGTRRLTAAVQATRGEGGAVAVTADLPLPLSSAPRAAAVAARVRLDAWPLAASLPAVGIEELPVEGELSADVTLDGTAGAPALRGEARLEDGAYDELFPLALALTMDDPGERLHVRLDASLDGAPAAWVEAAAPLDVADLLDSPAATLAAMVRAPLEATVAVPGLELQRLAGLFGIPRNLEGRVGARAEVTGTIEEPRGNLTASLARAVLAGYRDVAAQAELRATDQGVALAASVELPGQEVLRLSAALAAPVERLLSRAELTGAPLTLEAIVPPVELARTTSAHLPLSGRVEAKLTATGTLAAPRAELAFEGRTLAIDGRPLGDLSGTAQHASARTTADVSIRATAGGAVRVTAALDAPLGLAGGATPPLARAPLTARLVTDGLDLGLLPALLPGTVRSAGGKLVADVRAAGPLGRPAPRGRVAVSGGQLAISELGEWTGIVIDLEVDDDALELRKLRALRGSGTLDAHGSIRGLAEERARVEAHAKMDRFSIARAGVEVANLDLSADATGTYAPGELRVDVKVPGGTVRLVNQPRELQSLEGRKDIVVGKQPERRPRRGIEGEGPALKPFLAVIHLVVPGQLFVKSKSPVADVELQADVTYELAGDDDYASGDVEVVRGTVEPIDGRLFHVQRGRVQFTGGPLTAAMLDVEARYDNPSAVVTVVVSGPVKNPEIRLSSEPPMDDAQIAMLIATGRTELKRGSGDVGALTGEEAGYAALGALATQTFKSLVANKLPLDTVALDAGSIRAGRYFGDKVYVGYVRRFDADVEQGENENEVQLEYEITKSWTLESRYGSAESWGGSLIWSKDY
jgi:translocation and assembly module TamB